MIPNYNEMKTRLMLNTKKNTTGVRILLLIVNIIVFVNHILFILYTMQDIQVVTGWFIDSVN